MTGNEGRKIFPVSFGGRIRIAHGMVKADTNMPAGTILELVRLPKGARVLPNSMIHLEAGQNASMTICVGDHLKKDRYLVEVAPGANAKSLALDSNRFADYVIPEEVTIFATTGKAELAAGKKIVFDILYVID